MPSSNDHMHDALSFIRSRENAAIQAKLREIFKGACVHGGGRTVPQFLSSSKFRAFLDTFGFIDSSISQKDIDLIYVATSGNNHDMRFENFIIALYEVACRRSKLQQKSEKRIEAFEKMLSDIFSNESILPMYLNATPTISFSDDYSYMKLYYTYEKCFERIFETYSENIDDNTDEMTNNEKRYVMSIESFNTWAKKFQFYPSQISPMDIVRFFRLFEQNERDMDSMYLDLKQFADCILRIALYVYSKPQYTKLYTTNHEKIIAFIESWSEPYDRYFGVSLQNDMFDLNSVRVPSLKSLYPDKGSHDGGGVVTISGQDFDDRLGGVWVQFGGKVVPVNSHTSSEITFTTPKSEEVGITEQQNSVYVDVIPTEHQQTLEVEICRVVSVGVYATNCVDKATKYSKEKLSFNYVDYVPKFEIGPEIVVGLDPIFTRYCKINNPYNHTLLTLENYKLFREEYFKGIVDDRYQEFFNYSVTDRTVTKINFIGFVRCILWLILNYKPEAHPIDHLVNMVRSSDSSNRKSKSVSSGLLSSEDSVVSVEMRAIHRRPYRSFDIYSGPNLVALLEDKPGWIMTIDGSVSKHRFLNFKQYDDCVGESILRHIDISENFDHLLTRVIQSGFDIAVSQNPNTRTPTGRCWHILSKSKDKIGVMWDYPGQLSSIVWQPLHKEKWSKDFTITLYDWSSANYYAGDKNSVSFSPDFINFYHIFSESDSISSARFQVEKYGYKLVTRLYKLI